jgi:hypothetical protein
MFRWLWPSYDRQRTQEEQWVARRKVKEQLAIAANTEAEWEAMTRKWEANDYYRYEDCDLDYQTKMQGRMRDVSCLISCQQIGFILKLYCQAAAVTGQCLVISGQPQPVNSFFFSSLIEIYLRLLSPEEQAEYRKTLPDFELKIQDHYSDSNSTKKD